jgi:hypothetical protein
MTSVHEIVQRARNRAGALALDLAVIGDYVRPGYAPARPYQCSAHGHLVTRLYRPQRTAIEARRLAPCPRRRCGGWLYSDPATTRYEQILRDLLDRQAATVQPARSGLALIQTRIGGAPGQGGTAATDDDLGSQTS